MTLPASCAVASTYHNESIGMVAGGYQTVARCYDPSLPQVFDRVLRISSYFLP